MTQTVPHLCTFESRRAAEMRSLIERMQASAFVAPSMQEVPVEQNMAALDAIRRVLAGDVDALVLLTGVGTEAMLQVAQTAGLEEQLRQQMAALPLLIRGPKPAAVLTRLKLKYAVKAPEPNTWRELVTAIEDSDVTLAGKTVAVQEYGVANPEFYAALQSHGATVLPIPVYRWALPDDTQPLQQAIDQTIAGDFDALLFTSAQQVRHVLQIAERSGRQDAWRQAASQCLVASIGPTCTEALVSAGLSPGFEASPPKMGPLVRGTLATLSADDTI